jgi:two-component system sensor histidine kinase RpfC
MDLRQPSELDAAKPSDLGEQPVPLSGHILLAEDAQDISKIIRLQLESAGARVTVVDNGLDAVEKAYDEHFDAIVIDIHMPGMDGIEALAEMRARGINTPVIVTSADTSEERHRQCNQAGADGFVAKPFERAKFLTEVARHLKPATDTKPAHTAAPIHSELDLASPRMAAAVADFAHVLGQRVEEMEAALNRDDRDTIGRLAHQLKGAGGINGYMAVSEKALQLEQALEIGDPDAIRARLADLRSLRARILAGLRSDGVTLKTTPST